MNKRVSRVIFIFLLAFACQDEDSMIFQGVLLRDANNNAMGKLDARDLNDWQNEGKLSSEAMKLLDFDQDVDLTGTLVSPVQIAAYPNPVSDLFNLDFGSIQNSVVRIVVVNESMKVLFRDSFVGSYHLRLDMSDPKKFPSNEIVRVYYSLSALDNPNYFVGHGDVLICRVSKCRGI